MSDAPANLPFLFAAFAVVWMVFFAYAGYMSWRRRAVQQEVEEFRDQVERDGITGGTDRFDD